MGIVGVIGLFGCGPVLGRPSHSSQAFSKTKAKANLATKKARLKVIAYYDPLMGTVTPDPFALVKSHPGVVSYLAPLWYTVTPNGKILRNPEGNAAILKAQDHLSLMPLFTNQSGTDAFLYKSSTRTTLISHMAKLVKSHKYAGLSVDFRGLNSSDRKDLTEFMTGLKKSLPKGDLISLSVVPLNSKIGQSAAYDLPALNKVVSSMVLMAYDLHGPGTPAGPVAPFAWVQRCINTAVKAGVKPSKLYLGIADYGYLWTVGSTGATTIPLKVMHQHQYGVYTWNRVSKEAYDTYTTGGVKQVIWFENDRAAKDRIALAKKDHLAGVAFWRIGYEDVKWWDTVTKAIGPFKRPTPKAPRRIVKKGGSTGTRRIKGSTQKDIVAPAKHVKHLVKKARNALKPRIGSTKKHIIAPPNRGQHTKKATGS